jgi:hypothetical protein
LDLYVDGMFDKNQLKAKTDKLQTQIQTKKEEMRSVEQALAISLYIKI